MTAELASAASRAYQYGSAFFGSYWMFPRTTPSQVFFSGLLGLLWRGAANDLHQVAGAQLAGEGGFYVVCGQLEVAFGGADGFVEWQADFGAAQ